jgi:hypothetical protein
MTPREVDDLSIWEFTAAMKGWNKANGGDSKPKSLSEEEHDALMRKHA